MNFEKKMAVGTKKCYYSNTSKIILFDFYSRQWTSKAGPDVPSEQLQSLVKRLHLIGPKACKRGFHLKFLEHKCCILAFLNLTENKLRLWTRKCGPEDNVLHVLNQYKAFVSKNKIFQVNIFFFFVKLNGPYI